MGFLCVVQGIRGDPTDRPLPQVCCTTLEGVHSSTVHKADPFVVHCRLKSQARVSEGADWCKNNFFFWDHFSKNPNVLQL